MALTPDYTQSILTSIKKTLGIVDYDFFDADIIMHINSVFSDLNQIGIGPENGFCIVDETSVWNDFLSDSKQLQNVKSYMLLRVKLLFDPPSNSTVLASYEKQITEFAYRMYVTSDNNINTKESNHE